MWLHSKMTPLHMATLMATLLTGFHQFGHTNSSKRSALVGHCGTYVQCIEQGHPRLCEPVSTEHAQKCLATTAIVSVIMV